jgi:hypothetical protein
MIQDFKDKELLFISLTIDFRVNFFPIEPTKLLISSTPFPCSGTMSSYFWLVTDDGAVFIFKRTNTTFVNKIKFVRKIGLALWL